MVWEDYEKVDFVSETITPNISELENALVIDSGSGLTKAGFSGGRSSEMCYSYNSRKTEKSRIYHIRTRLRSFYCFLFLHIIFKDCWVGDEALAKRGILKVKYPVEHGLVTNWNDMEKIWHHLFYNELRAWPEECPVLMTETVFNPKSNREKMTSIMFETFNILALFVGVDSVLSLYQTGRSSGLVLEIGDSVIHSTPIYEGCHVPYAARRMSFGGRDIDGYLVKILSERGYQMRTSSERQIVREMKEKLAYVSLEDYDDEEEKTQDREYEYTLPDGEKMFVGNQLFRAPEILFKPSLMETTRGELFEGIDEMTFNSIQECPSSFLELRSYLYKNIVISGGSSCFRGLDKRLNIEIEKLAPYNSRIRVHAHENRRFGAWVGGSIVTSLSSFRNMWILKDEYDDAGATIVHRKCFMGCGVGGHYKDGDDSIRIWNVENGKNFELCGHSLAVEEVHFFHNESNKVISGSRDRTIKSWDLRKKKEISTFKGYKGLVYSVSLLFDNNTVASGGSNNEIRIVDMRRKKFVKVLKDHKDCVNAVRFDSDSFSLASGSGYNNKDNSIQLFDIRTWKLLHVFEEHKSRVYSLSFHPSGKYLLSGSLDCTVRLFDLEEKKVIFTLPAHEWSVRCVCFSPDGNSFASAGNDENVNLWSFVQQNHGEKEEQERIETVEASTSINMGFMGVYRENIKLKNGVKELEKQLYEKTGIFTSLQMCFQSQQEEMKMKNKMIRIQGSRLQKKSREIKLLRSETRKLDKDLKQVQNFVKELKKENKEKVVVIEKQKKSIQEKEMEAKNWNKKFEVERVVREKYEKEIGRLESEGEENKEKLARLERNVKFFENLKLEKERLEEKIRQLIEFSRIRLSRIDQLLKNVEEEDFWSFDPTKYASNEGKLEYFHNISRTKFVCKFQKGSSRFGEFESYFEKPERCNRYENVIVDSSSDENLKKYFVEDRFYKDLKIRVKDEIQNKELEKSVSNLKQIVREMVENVVDFFKIPLRITELNVKELKDAIEESQKKNGKNNLYVGDLKGKCGYCRHHASLFKFVCDLVEIRCKMVFVYDYHAWNVVQIKDRFYVVDLTNFKEEGLIVVERYYQILKQNLEENVKMLEEKAKKEGPYSRFLLDKTEKTLETINQFLTDEKLEKIRTLRIKDYTNGLRKDEAELSREGRRGGSGDITIYRIEKDVFHAGNTLLFSQGELLAVKRIRIGAEFLPGFELNLSKKLRYVNQEITHMKILDHTSIIPVIGSWEEIDPITKNPCVFIAMKGMHFDGKDFFDRMRNVKFPKKEEDEGEIDEEEFEQNLTNESVETRMKKRVECLFFLIEVARGLRYLSRMNVTHLDMKLENVVIEWDEERNQISDVRIIDFGGAKNDGIKTSNYFTTDGYDPPEIIQEKVVKEIRVKIEQLEEKVRKSNMDRHLFRQIESKFLELIDLKLPQVEVEFKKFILLQKRNQTLYEFGFPQWEEVIQKRFERGKILSLGYLNETEASVFDFRSDVFSFGVMMEMFLKENLIPHELLVLVERCKKEGKRDRPTWGEILFSLRNHLSFYNQKMKERKESELLRE